VEEAAVAVAEQEHNKIQEMRFQRDTAARSATKHSRQNNND
jgi:hypothetical protein